MFMPLNTLANISKICFMITKAAFFSVSVGTVRLSWYTRYSQLSTGAAYFWPFMAKHCFVRRAAPLQNGEWPSRSTAVAPIERTIISIS